jgi:hypothetical protein
MSGWWLEKGYHLLSRLSFATQNIFPNTIIINCTNSILLSKGKATEATK